MNYATQRRCDLRHAVTLLETIVVLFIIAVLLVFFLPAVQRARDAAKNAVCKNNLHQIVLAIHQYWIVTKKLPNPGRPGVVSGWAIEILPFLEDRVLADQLAGYPGINQPTIAQQIGHRPLSMTCPFGWEGNSSTPGVPASHYAIQGTWAIGDVPLSSREPWVQSPEMDLGSLPRDEGPHSGGYFIASIGQVPNSGDVRWFAGK